MECWMDIETNGLYEHLIDFSILPLARAETARIWMIGFLYQDGQFKVLRGKDVTRENVARCLEKVTKLINHNLIGYDLPVLKLFDLADYRVPYSNRQSGLLNGRKCCFIDTLIWSKLDNADRFGGHSLKNWGKIVGRPKLESPLFDQESDEMETYLEGDCRLAFDVYQYLKPRVGGPDWAAAYATEAKLRDLTTTRQTIFGFKFDVELANKLVRDLTQEMEKIRNRVNAGMPKSPLAKSKLKEYTPPARQFKADGTVSVAMVKFIEKHGGTLDEASKAYAVLGRAGVLPMPATPLVEYRESAIDDIPHVKKWLVSLGWVPTEYAQRDLSSDNKKVRLPDLKIKAAIDKYVAQTIGSEYQNDRCTELEVKPKAIYTELLKKMEKGGSIYVPTMPKLRVGNDKKICPNILEIPEAKELIEGIVRYYTLRHRLASIAGGVIEYDEETGEVVSETGWLTKVMPNGRILTPADTLGTPTARYKHSVVVNPPKAAPEIIYGHEIRSLFGAGDKLMQIGFDFASLEARCQAHAVYKFFGGKEEAQRLIQPAPNDVHTNLVRLLEQSYGIEITRNQAKNIFYGTVYGAGIKKIAKMLRVQMGTAKQVYDGFWEANPALAEFKKSLEVEWEKSGKRHISGLDGRKLVVRKKHALVNTRLQADGAIIVKNTLLRIAHGFESQDQLGDPFLHSEITPLKYWFMIVNHDEQQAGITKDLLSFRKKGGGETCQVEFKGYVFERSPAIDIILKAVQDVNTHFALDVPMSIEWKVGKNWADCH